VIPRRQALFLGSALLLSGSLVGAACGDKGGDSGTVPVAAKSFATFNAGLAIGFVPAAETRAPQVAEAVANIDADVVCLQEVWIPRHVSMVAQAAPANFAWQDFPEASQDESTTPACTNDELDPLIQCADDSCGDACDDELIDCIFSNCPIEFVTLPYGCMDCAMAMVGGEVSDVADTCLNGAVSYAYDGSYGIGILSKWEMKDTELLTLDSTTNRRGVLHTTVAAPDGDLDVYCTHLSAVFDTIPYPSESGSWGEEQAAQIQTMRDWIDSTSSTGRVVLMGDMNTGPALSGIEGEVPDNYAALAEGFSVPYVDGDPTCTFCDANPLVGGEGDGGVVIDHIMLRGLDGNLTGERILTDDITATSCDAEISCTYSDHYGVKVSLTP